MITDAESGVILLSIQASELTLDHLIQVTEQSGEGFQNLNMTLLSTDAFGVLRKDLITALGVGRAKRFLLRYAFQSGAHEARILKDAIIWTDDIEWLIAGSKLHHLTGRVFSYTERFHVDMEKGIFDVSGYWLDSYEAKQHLRYFPVHSECICHFLVGYASGYTSECLGKQVIFKEIKCKGKGDEYCSYVGKTVEQWGKEISEESLYYEDEELSDERDQMFRKVEQQNEKLEIGYSLSRNLTKAMLEGEGFPAFSQLLGECLNCSVLIENRNYETIAEFGKKPGMKTLMSVSNFLGEEMINSGGNEIIETTLKGKTFTLLTVPITIKDQINGFITIDINQRSNDFIKDLLERVATIAALHMQNEQVAIETEQRLEGELLEKLLNEKKMDWEWISNRFSYLGYNLSEPHYIVHIDIAGKDKKKGDLKEYEYLKVRNQITNFLQKQKEYVSNILLLTKLNTVQVVISKKLIEDEQTTIKDFVELLLKNIKGDKEQICMGISNETHKLSDFNKRAEEARKSVELAKFKSTRSAVILTSDLGHLTLFLNAREPEELELFAEENLEPILNYDKKKNSELLLTLFYYSQNEFNLHKTAREMSISISGMRYRIQQIEDLLDIDLSNSNCRFEIQISLQIFLVLGKIRIYSTEH